MKRTLKKRVVVALAVTLAAATLGLLAGYWSGREFTLLLAARRLQHEAARSIGESDTYAHDVHNALDAMNASIYPHCSVEDMEFLHNLLYHSIFLKELGRIRDNKIVCSTTLGAEHPSSTELPKPSGIGTDGVKVYRNPLLFGLSDVAIVGLRAGDSYVVLYHYFDRLQEGSPVHFLTTTRGAMREQTQRFLGGATPPSWQQLSEDGDFRIEKTMYSNRCSSLSIDNICRLAYLSDSDALQSNHAQLLVFMILGGACGGLFGFVVSLLYRRNRNMEHQLRHAIHQDKLRLVYQPIVDLHSGRIVSAEALARWNDEDGVAIGPDVFIEIAERRGFVGEITRLVVRHALRDFGDLLRGHPEFHLSINVAASDLGDPSFLTMLDESLHRAGVNAESLTIEITEGSTARYKEALETIHQLRRRGHSIHIDDFGTGYSSLSYLHNLSIDAIKIDRSFTMAIGTEAVTVAILPQILSMAETLALQVVVEGIETSQQANYFAALELPILGQGWLFGRPVATEEFHRLLDANEKQALVAATSL